MSAVSISAVNFSFAFQSSCSSALPPSSCTSLDTLVEVNYSWFTTNWGAFLERCELKNNLSLSYNSLAYNHRFSYGNGSIQTPWTVPGVNSPTRMLILKLVLDKTCVGDIYMENHFENGVNQISDATFSPVSFQIFRFGAAFPVDFLSFEAEKAENDQVKLNWVTQQELNSDYFQVQKSYTGRFDDPIKLGNVAATGVSDEKRSYEFWDTSPPASQVFYRLKQVDTDGVVQYSTTVEVKFEDSRYAMYAVADRSDKTLTIKLFSSEDNLYKLALLDLQGRILRQGPYRFGPNEGDQLIWQTNDLPAGIYLLQVIDNTFQEKTIKVYLY